MIEAAYKGDANVWAISRGLDVVGAVVTTLTRYPTGKVVGQVLCAGGDDVIGPKRMAQYRVALNQWAKHFGADEIEWLGREERVRPSGWSRFFDDAVSLGAVSSVPVI